MLSIIGPDTDHKDKIMFHLKAATDGIPIREGLDAWAKQTPSRFVVEALDFHIKRFRRELLAQLFVWLIPSYIRKRIFKMPVDMPLTWFDVYTRLDSVSWAELLSDPDRQRPDDAGSE